MFHLQDLNKQVFKIHLREWSLNGLPDSRVYWIITYLNQLHMRQQ